MKIENSYGDLQVTQDDNRIDIINFVSELPDINPSGWLVCLEGVKIAKIDDFNHALAYGINALIILSKDI